MIFLKLFLINLLSSAAEHSTEPEHCATETCNDLAKPGIKKLIFYDVNPAEGFNLRRDVYMRFAIMLNEAHQRGRTGWGLVLPPWQNLYHWRTSRSKSKPLKWSSFFNVDSLASYAPVRELQDIIDESGDKPLEIDTLYVLKNFDNPFENGVFEEKWQFLTSECEYEGNFWGYNDKVKTKEIICVRFQGKISKLWELIYQHPSDRLVMFMHGEIPLHDNYGTRSYWDCRKSMKFNNDLIETANKFIKKKLVKDCKANCYLAIHWRRRDFAWSRPNDVPSISGTVKQIKEKIDKYLPEIKKVFVATDADSTELKQLKNNLEDEDLKVYVYDPSKSDLEGFKDGGVAIIDQIICSQASYFIGTHDSTFSFRIQEEREILGWESNTTFNRFCPDSGLCEKPSQWRIIN